MNNVRLVMDSVAVTSPGGERLQVELASALDRTCPDGAVALVLHRPDQSEIGGYRHLEARPVSTPAASRFDRWRWLRRGLPRHVADFRATATFVAGGVFPKHLLRQCGVVCTTNNLAPFAADSVSSYPLHGRLRLAVSRALIARSLRLADRLVLHSDYSLRTLSATAGDLAAKTTVVLTGIPQAIVRAAAGEPPTHPHGGRPYFLYFSALRWYKNHLGLIDAYRQLASRVENPPELLLAGPCPDPDCLVAIERAIEEAGLEHRVRYLGELDGDDVPAWLQHATVNVFPSLAETNSVIVAEILGMGGVLAASDLPSVRETAAAAAELFDAKDGAAIARTLESLWLRPERREGLRRHARQRADQLSWDDCGRAIWRAAGEAADCHRRRLGVPAAAAADPAR